MISLRAPGVHFVAYEFQQEPYQELGPLPNNAGPRHQHLAWRFLPNHRNLDSSNPAFAIHDLAGASERGARTGRSSRHAIVPSRLSVEGKALR